MVKTATATTKKTVKKSSKKKLPAASKSLSVESQSQAADSSDDLTDEIADEIETKVTTKKKSVKKKARVKEVAAVESTPTKKKVKKKSKVADDPPAPVVKKKSSLPAKNETTKVRGRETDIIYTEVNVMPYFDKKYNPRALGSMTADKAKEILGWVEESEGLPLKKDFLFKDRNGKRVVCTSNLNNRRFNRLSCECYMLEILRNKWKLNGEPMIVDDTGMVQDAQHRLVALVWAAQEWLKNPAKWQPFWKTEPTIDTVLITGVSHDDDTINTINTGKPRTLSDVVFRSAYFADIHPRKRGPIANIGSSAIRVLWHRSGWTRLSATVKLPHSEAIEIVERHPTLLKAIREINTLNGSKGAISGYVHPGIAAGLLYLMASSLSDIEEYEAKRNDSVMDFTRWDQACEFWDLIANVDTKTEPVTESLLNIPEHTHGSYAVDFRYGTIVKAWNLFVRKKKITPELITLMEGEDEIKGKIIAETPSCGGIDIGDLSNYDSEEDDSE